MLQQTQRKFRRFSRLPANPAAGTARTHPRYPFRRAGPPGHTENHPAAPRGVSSRPRVFILARSNRTKPENLRKLQTCSGRQERSLGHPQPPGHPTHPQAPSPSRENSHSFGVQSRNNFHFSPFIFCCGCFLSFALGKHSRHRGNRCAFYFWNFLCLEILVKIQKL